jgi:hypothetical protein
MMVLAMVSGVDPAMNGTKTVTLRCGHSCAEAWPQVHTSANRPARNLLGTIASPSRFLCYVPADYAHLPGIAKHSGGEDLLHCALTAHSGHPISAGYRSPAYRRYDPCAAASS